MNSVALAALSNLLERANAAWKRDATSKPIYLLFSEASFPAYLSIESHADKVQCNADLKLARRAGAIEIDWDERAGDSRHVRRIQLSDADKLAHFLNVDPHWVEVDRATNGLAAFTVEYPILNEVLSAWRQGKKVRGSIASQWPSWSDAVRVLRTCRDAGAIDIPIRRLSARLFGNSKRLEALWPLLDVLLQLEVGGIARPAEEVYGELGLVKFPPTFLMSGAVNVHVGRDVVKLVRPYLGFSPTEIEGFSSLNSVRYLLSIENLTTFHELARQVDPAEGGLLVYTAGMPSPSWLRIYRLILEHLPHGVPIFHSGDIDIGGFRIADYVAKHASLSGHHLCLHGMDGVLCVPDVEELEYERKLSNAELAAIDRICDRRGWRQEGNWTRESRRAVEQEAMRAVAPITPTSAAQAQISEAIPAIHPAS